MDAGDRPSWAPPQVYDLAEVRDALAGGGPISDAVGTQGSAPP